MKELKNRLEYIDLIKGFSILLVVLGHIYDFENNIKIWIYSFHMPLFFIISGFFVNKDIKLGRLLSKKFKSLIIPYISFGIGIMLLMYFSINLRNELNEYIMFFMIGVGRDALWFLPALFIVEILFNIIDRIESKSSKYIMLVILFLIGLYGKNYYENMILIVIYRAFIGLGFYSIGNYIYDYVTNCNLSYLSLVIIFATNMILALNNSYIDLWGLYFNDKFIYVFCSIVGSLSVIIFFKKISNRIKYKKILMFFGRNTLIIMSTQQIIINYINIVTKSQYYSTKEGLIVLLIVMIIELPIIYIINNYLPFMIGKLKKQKI